MSKNRVLKEGYYWVVYLPEVADEWTIAEWMDNDTWWIIGGDGENPTDASKLIVGEFISPPKRWNREGYTKGLE